MLAIPLLMILQKNTNRTPILESLANELEKNYFVMPDQIAFFAGFEQQLEKYNFVTVGIAEKGESYSAPALPFDDSGLLLLPILCWRKIRR